ncbi:hypothetical protein EUGRSUZ_E02453 [Eucalyptus grandis]|uniref:Uncharacterized protein n=2 Tax=Eucalyptus grandis TaxID=71139 RepID=A0ACC3KXA0_EUCGR|nr:hypothetical protein EUGRSUZ_E02453 [Eucalyptus grandis]
MSPIIFCSRRKPLQLPLSGSGAWTNQGREDFDLFLPKPICRSYFRAILHEVQAQCNVWHSFARQTDEFEDRPCRTIVRVHVIFRSN